MKSNLNTIDMVLSSAGNPKKNPPPPCPYVRSPILVLNELINLGQGPVQLDLVTDVNAQLVRLPHYQILAKMNCVHRYANGGLIL